MFKRCFRLYSVYFICFLFPFYLFSLSHDNIDERKVNLTAPNYQTRYLSADFTDTDKDGMTDAAEIKYGYAPQDSSVYPGVSAEDFFTDNSFSDQKEISINQQLVGSDKNRIHFAFKNFTPNKIKDYSDFLKLAEPILYRYLGPPAESFTCEIRNFGEETDVFMAIEGGRVILCDASFNPRLILHELVHVWKGRYQFSSDSNWQYQPDLSGYEEATAEGMAYELIHEYVRAYPDDSASGLILKNRSYQYWSPLATYYDLIKYQRSTGGGSFWAGNVSRFNYSIAATTFQLMVKKNPDCYRQIMQAYYRLINQNPAWHPNKEDLISLWRSAVPRINGIDTRIYLNRLPVFQGHALNQGLYVIPLYYGDGYSGRQSFTVSYAASNGKLWWGISEQEMKSSCIPDWIKYVVSWPDADGNRSCFIDMQNQPFIVNLYNQNGQCIKSVNDITDNNRYKDNTPVNLGWKEVPELNADLYPQGLYYEKITFTDLISYDPGAADNFYFMGMAGLNQDRTYHNESLLMIGITGVNDGYMTVNVAGIDYTEPIRNGTALFCSKIWPFDLEAEIPIIITNDSGISHTYYRTILEVGTSLGYHQQKFLIRDHNFDGIEDQYETDGLCRPALIKGVTHWAVYNKPIQISWDEIPGEKSKAVINRNGSCFPYVKGSVLGLPGNYQLEVIMQDKTSGLTAGTLIKFAINYKNQFEPVIKGVQNDEVYDTTPVYPDYDNQPGYIAEITVKRNGSLELYRKGLSLYKNGQYEISVKAFYPVNRKIHTIVIRFTIDRDLQKADPAVINRGINGRYYAFLK